MTRSRRGAYEPILCKGQDVHNQTLFPFLVSCEAMISRSLLRKTFLKDDLNHELHLSWNLRNLVVVFKKDGVLE